VQMIRSASLRPRASRRSGRNVVQGFLLNSQCSIHRTGRTRHFHVSTRQFAGHAKNTLDAKFIADKLRHDPSYASQLASALDPETLSKMVEVSSLTGCTTSLVPSPTYGQLWKHSVRQAVPFFGFGLFDNMVMICVGESIDSTFGVTLGFSTMVAAGCGQMVSDSVGITLQGIIERFADGLRLPDPGLSGGQARLGLVHTVSQVSRTIGIFFGCFVGMFPLLFIDTNRNKLSEKLLQVLPAEQRLEFSNSLEVVKFDDGEKIIEYGTPGEYLYLLTHGSVEVVGRDDRGEPLKACDLDVGSIIGELEFITGDLCVADVIATSQVRAQRLSKADFTQIAGDECLNMFREFVSDQSNSRYLYYRMHSLSK